MSRTLNYRWHEITLNNEWTERQDMDDESYVRPSDGVRFTEWLRRRAERRWEELLEHRFVRECAAGTVPQPVFEAYLKQEYAFVETSRRGLGYAIARAPSMREASVLSEALHALVTEQRTYFEETFDELGVDGWRDPELLPATRHFRDFVLRTSATGGYAETLAPMVAAEWAYATWCQRAADAAPSAATDPVGRWIELHAERSFQAHAAWLREELDRLGPDLLERRQRAVADAFERTLEHELRFHSAPYERASNADEGPTEVE